MGSQIGALFGGLFGDAGQNFVDLQGGAGAVFGTKPQVAPFVPIDLSAETQKALTGDLSNFSQISDFLNQVIPGFSDMLSTGTSNALSELKGEIPTDVQSQIQRSSAFQSLAGGYGGTPMSRALTARDLGLTSLNLTQMGQNSAQMWANTAEQAFSPWTVTTQQQSATTAANNAGQQAYLQNLYNVRAAPDPGAAGVFNVDAALGQQMLSFGMAAAGGGFGGGGGGSTNTAQTNPANWWQLYGNTGGNTPGGAYQYNSSTGQFGPVPVAQPVAWTSSDRRLKENLKLIGKSAKGYNIWRFNFKGNPAITYEGVMADEILRARPDAVRTNREGWLCVDYGKLDVQMHRVN